MRQSDRVVLRTMEVLASSHLPHVAWPLGGRLTPDRPTSLPSFRDITNLPPSCCRVGPWRDVVRLHADADRAESFGADAVCSDCMVLLPWCSSRRGPRADGTVAGARRRMRDRPRFPAHGFGGVPGVEIDGRTVHCSSGRTEVEIRGRSAEEGPRQDMLTLQPEVSAAAAITFRHADRPAGVAVGSRVPGGMRERPNRTVSKRVNTCLGGRRS